MRSGCAADAQRMRSGCAADAHPRGIERAQVAGSHQVRFLDEREWRLGWTRDPSVAMPSPFRKGRSGSGLAQRVGSQERYAVHRFGRAGGCASRLSIPSSGGTSQRTSQERAMAAGCWLLAGTCARAQPLAPDRTTSDEGSSSKKRTNAMSMST